MYQRGVGLRAPRGGGAQPRGHKGQMAGQAAATPVGARNAQPTPPDGGANLGSALLRIASALEQKREEDGPGRLRFEPSD